MWATFLAMALVILVGYMWLTRGFFSALLHLACTIAAGAIAFSVWEPTAYWLLDVAPTRGWLVFLRDTAWGLALGVPFAISLAILRVAMDKLVGANVNCDPRVEYIGGGICGLGSGIITAGIVIMSLGSMRFQQDWLGYQPVAYFKEGSIGKGSLVRNTSMFRPYVDELTAGFYEMVSRGALRPEFGKPLGDLYPNLEEVPGLLRFTYEGKSRNTLKRKDFTLLHDKSYLVGDPQAGSDVDALMQDSWNQGTQQTALDMAGNPVKRGYLAGLVVQFESGAKETGGGSQVVIGPAQVRVLATNARGDDSRTIFPVAVVSQAASDTPALGRWRYDTERIFIASVGGASEAVMGFEFVIPTGFKPKYLYVKNIRVDVPEFDAEKDRDRMFGSWQSRDSYIKSGRIDKSIKISQESGDAGEPDTRGAELIKLYSPNQQPKPGYLSYEDAGIATGRQIGFIIRDGQERGLKVEDSGGKDGKLIVDGEETYSANEIKANSTMDNKLKIKLLSTPDDVVIVRINVSIGRKMSILSKAAQAADPNRAPVLVDANGTSYDAVGYIYKDASIYKIRYTPGGPVQGLIEVPQLSRSQPDADLQLIFRCSKGVSLTKMMIGNKVICDWSETPVKLDR
jgi:hypothetical protein